MADSFSHFLKQIIRISIEIPPLSYCDMGTADIAEYIQYIRLFVSSGWYRKKMHASSVKARHALPWIAADHIEVKHAFQFQWNLKKIISHICK